MFVSPELQRWLLEGSDPSVRRRVLRELLDRPADDPEVRAATEETTRSGWAHTILAQQPPEGQWDAPGTSSAELYVPKYISTNFRLLVLAELGLTKETPGVARAVELVWSREGGPDGGLGGKGSEVCYTGNALRMLLELGYADDPRLPPLLDWLVNAQKSDGGWHCFPSETGTLDCWEALAAFARLPGPMRSDAVRAAVDRGVEFYLERGLLQEGSEPYAPWRRLHFPAHYYYDVLVGLDVLTRLGRGRDPRLGPALDLLESRRDAQGRWPIDAAHPDLPADEPYQVGTPVFPFVLEPAGRPSRWVTVTALNVLRAAGRA